MVTLRNIRILIAISLVASIITACGDSKKPEVTQAQIDAHFIYEGKEVVRKRMKDPVSTEFRDVSLSIKSGAPAVCGEVNSKNSFGGYVGFQQFVSVADTVFMKPDTTTDGMEKAWQQFCGK